MDSFHRIKRDSPVPGFIALTFALLLSMVFMLIGFLRVGEDGRASMDLIFGVPGVATFLLFLRGGWMMTGRSLVHVFSMDRNKVVWGFVGKEQELDASEIDRIYWDDSDGFSFQMTMKDGRQVRFLYMDNVVPFKSRPTLLSFLRTSFPSIPLAGNIDKRTKRAADELAA